MEERVTRLETHVEHIFRYLADLKAALEKLEAKFDEKFNKLEAKFDDKFEKMDARLTRIIYWALGLYIALATTLLGVMARGFHWM